MPTEFDPHRRLAELEQYLKKRKTWRFKILNRINRRPLLDLSTQQRIRFAAGLLVWALVALTAVAAIGRLAEGVL